MLVLGADAAGAIELEGAAMELAGAAAGAVADAVWLAGAGLLAGAAAEVPESISDFLLLRVFFAGAAVVSAVAVVAAGAAAGVAGVAPESAAAFLLL